MVQIARLNVVCISTLLILPQVVAWAAPIPETVSRRAATEGPAAQAPDKLAQLLDRGWEALNAGHYNKAARAFSKAVEVSGGASQDAVFGLATANLRLRQYSKALGFGRQALHLSTTPAHRAFAENLVGTILYEEAQRWRPGTRGRDVRLAEAETCFRTAVDLSDGRLSAA